MLSGSRLTKGFRSATAAVPAREVVPYHGGRGGLSSAEECADGRSGGRAGRPTRDPLSVGMACDEFAGRSRSLLGGKLSRERRHGHEKLAVTEHYIVLMRYGMNG